MPAHLAHLDGIRDRLRREGLDALVCRLAENVLCLSGYWPRSGVSFLFVPVGGMPLLIAPELEAPFLPEGVGQSLFAWGRLGESAPLESVRRVLARQAAVSRLGWEGDFEAVAPAHVAGEVLVPAASTAAMLRDAFPAATLVDASPLLRAERARKTPADLAGLRRAAAVAERGVVAFERAIRPGVSECALIAEVEAEIARAGGDPDGADSVRGFAQLLSGPRTAGAWAPWYLATRRALAPGDLVLLELATVADGYWSDITRMAVVGEPDARQREVRHAIDGAVAAAIAACRPGQPARAADAAARAALEVAGLGRAFPHHTGHGLGFRYHEPVPWLHPDSADTLESGMVCTIEPGVYLEGFGGIRIEENIAIGPAGAELLSVPARPWP